MSAADHPRYTPQELQPGLILVHGNRAEALRDVLVAWMKHYPLAPLEDEVVLVQSNGIAQWLRLALADEREGGCGIAAAMRFDLPSRFFWRVYRAVLGRDAVPEVSPLDESRLVWRLMRLLPELLRDPVYAPLARFLADDTDARKRFQLAGRLADLFDQYQVYRADWLAAWAAGDDVLPALRGQPAALPADQLWQPALWRALCRDLSEAGLPTTGGRAAVHERFMEAVEALGDARPAGMPRRVLVFGISSLPQQSLEVLAEMARWSQVLMCVHNPCEHHWADIVQGRELLRRERASRQSRRASFPDDPAEDALHIHAHPLLAAWGRQGRDFIALLDTHDDATARGAHAEALGHIGQRIDHFVPTGGDTLLAQLQDDIRDLRPLAETRERWPAVAPDDGSVVFHVAHGPQREVEILHDRLLAAFDADPTLRPRDIIVMVPDIDAYAPHVRAVFGLHDAADPRRIPFCLADQGRRAIDPLVQGLELLLGLPNARVTASDVLDLLDVPALRRRFGLDEADLPTLARWIRGANVRWGLHAEHRESLGLPAGGDAADHSWLFGLRRMLLGYAAGGEVAWQGIESHGEIGGLDAALLGPLAQLVARLDAAWHSLRTPASPDEWAVRLSQLMADFFDTQDDAEAALTVERLDTVLAEWRAACVEAGLTEALPLAVVAEQWMSALDSGGLTQRFFAGAVTFATLMPMRAIPFRHVCLLGMNDRDYPRTRTPLDFDLMGRAGQYRPGDRSRREDDRYLFLEALLSARDVLYVSWVGRGITDNAELPPSVLVGQLRDHLAAGWGWRDGDALLARLTVEHPLQPFSARYFGGDAALFTYAREWRAAAPEASAHGMLAPVERDAPLTLDELQGFLRDPVAAFFRDRLGVSFGEADMVGEDVEPFSPDGLARWRFEDALITAQVRAVAVGEDPVRARDDVLARLGRRGEFAPGAFGELFAEELVAPMDELVARYRAALAEWPEVLEDVAVDVVTDIDGRRIELADRLGGLRCSADGVRGRIVVERSALVETKRRGYRPHVVWRHWVAHLAAQLAAPTETLLLAARGEVRLAPLDAHTAESRLAALLRAWDAGLRRPLPLAVRSGFAWLGAKEEQREARARDAYEGGFQHAGERGQSPHLARAWPDFDALQAGGFEDCVAALLAPLHVAMPGHKEDA